MERVYKTMRNAGALNIVIGIIITVLLAFLDVEKANKKWDAEHQKEAQA